MTAWFYILRLRSGALYPGSTGNLKQRLKDHESGRACRTTRFDPPVGSAYQEEVDTFFEARHREAQVKRWTRAKKEALIAGDVESLKRLAKRRKAPQ
jgi:putative endonuclease